MLSPVRSSPVIVKGGRSIKVGMANVNSLVVTRCLLFVCQSFCLISSSSCGLSCGGRCRSCELAPCLPILSSVIGSCQTNVQGRQVRFNSP